jgi:hypothetical protein
MNVHSTAGDEYTRLSLCLLLNIIKMIKSRRMRLVVQVARIVEIRNMFEILVRKPERKRSLRRPRCGWRIILKLILEKQSLGCGVVSCG